MPANTAPIFTLTPNCKTVNLAAAACTSRTSISNQVTAVTGGTNGTLVSGIAVLGTGTTTAGMVRVWHKPSGGSSLLIGEIPVSAVTPSATVQAFTGKWVPQNGKFVIQSGDLIEVTTHNAEAFNVTPDAGDY